MTVTLTPDPSTTRIAALEADAAAARQAAADNLARAERAEAQRDRYAECLMAVSAHLYLPHAVDGPCDDEARYSRELAGLEELYQRTEKDRVAHSDARFKAEAENVRLRRSLKRAERFMAGFEGDELQAGIDDDLRAIRAALVAPEGGEG